MGNVVEFRTREYRAKRFAPAPSSVQNTISAINSALAPPPSASAPPAGDANLDVSYADRPLTVTRAPRPTVDAAPSAPPPSAKPSWSDIPGDIITGLGAGINRGVAALPGLPGDISRLADAAPAYLLGKGAEALGLLPKGETFDSMRKEAAGLDLPPDRFAPPTSADTTKVYEAVTGKLPEPQTVPGQYAETIGSFLPTAGQNVVTAALLPAVASETAGQVTKGTGLEPYARVAGGIAGGTVGLAATAAGDAANVATNALKEYRLPAQPGGPEIVAARGAAGQRGRRARPRDCAAGRFGSSCSP